MEPLIKPYTNNYTCRSTNDIFEVKSTFGSDFEEHTARVHADLHRDTMLDLPRQTWCFAISEVSLKLQPKCPDRSDPLSGSAAVLTDVRAE